ncbi:MAG TPA: DUF58 domain-containing protein [Flavobacteriaceae bacterium]|nr:DUF58 domain-containing protein [Flavobacteriaceae bacterium]
MNLQSKLNKTSGFTNLELLAQEVVEGFISGIHKSPFHGFSAEFAEHKIYNQGESTKHIDWKLFAKTDKLYTKRYEEETNLRCHLIIDNSTSMHYPFVSQLKLDSLNKIGFSVLASAALMNIFKKQRDAVGLSIYSDDYDFYAPEKGSERHHHVLLAEMEKAMAQPSSGNETKTYTYLHQIAEKLKRRSLVFLFTDMFQASKSEEELFEALHHLRYNKNEVVLFHTFDREKELLFNFDNRPKRYVDVETGETIDLYADNIKTNYKEAVNSYFEELKAQCIQYKIKYVPVDIQQGFEKILTTYLVERQKFI